MKTLLKKLDWWFDINIAYYFYNGNKIYRYHEYLDRKWGVPNTTIRQKIVELNPDAVLWDDLDNSIIGMSDDERVVYSIQRMNKQLQTLHSWTYEEAEDWIGFNIISAYVGEFTPVHIYEF